MEQKIERIIVGEIATNCWIYPLGEYPQLCCNDRPEFSPCAIIDPGAEGKRILSRVKELKLFPIYILLTHGHFDHIAAVPALVKAQSPNGAAPKIAIHRLDAEYLGPGSYEVHCRSFSIAAGNTLYVDTLWEDMPAADTLLEEGTTIGPFTVLHLPGHTRGSIAFWDKKANVLFSGDTLFQGDYGRTDLPGGSEAQIIESLKRLFTLDPNIAVFPGHGQVTNIGAERLR